MPKKKYEVLLTPEDESVLKSMTHSGNKYSAREILHAQVLLHSNDSRPELKKNNRELAEWLDISPTTVNQIRKTYAESGLEAALHRKTRITPPVASKITGDFEAKVIAAALGLRRKGTPAGLCGCLRNTAWKRNILYLFPMLQSVNC